MKSRLLSVLLLLPLVGFSQFAAFPTPGLTYGSIYHLNVFDGGGYFPTSMKFYQNVQVCGETWSHFSSPGNALIRAENGQYWHLPNPSDCKKLLMYDFSKHAGDTVEVYGLGELFVQQEGTFTLDNGEVRKMLVLGPLSFPDGQFTWVDGIGDINYSFFRSSDFEGGFEELICMRDSASGIFFQNSIHPLDCDSLLCPKPWPQFYFDCHHRSFSFINQTINSTDFIWNFGDGETSTDENPTHTFQNPGCYKVSLTATTDCLPGQQFSTHYYINVDDLHFWKKTPNQPPPTYKIQMLDSQNGWALHNKTIWKTTDGWATRDSIPYPGNPRGVYELQFRDATHGIIEVQTQDPTYPNGRDILWTNDGLTFSLMVIKDKHNITAIERVNDSTAIVAGHYTGGHMTRNWGATWEEVDFPGLVSLVEDFQAMGGDTIYLVGVNQIWPPYSFCFGKTTDGFNWETSCEPAITGVNHMTFINANEGWMVGAFSIYHTQNAGETWEWQHTSDNGSFYQIGFADEMTGWAVGHHVGILATTDGGKNWKQEACSRLEETTWGLNVLSKTEAYTGSKHGFLKWSADPDTIRTCPTTVGIRPHLPEKTTLTIFPNPSTGKIQLEIPPAFFENEPARLTIFDALGRPVFQEKTTGPNPVFNFEKWPPGLYFIQVQRADGRQLTGRFLRN